MTNKSKQHETTSPPADDAARKDETDAEETDEQAPAGIAQEGATAFNTARAQPGHARATTVHGRQTDWGVDYEHAELSGLGEGRADTARDWDAAPDDAAPGAADDAAATDTDEEKSDD